MSDGEMSDGEMSALNYRRRHEAGLTTWWITRTGNRGAPGENEDVGIRE